MNDKLHENAAWAESRFDLDEEGLFARDIDGQLIRLDEATADDYDKDVTLTIDGETITVKKAVPLKDAQGNIVRDSRGNTIPTPTTIYDAATSIFVKKPGDVHPIPTLCHKEHMRPVGVCRVCVVEVFRNHRGTRIASGKLVPACSHRVEQGMEVQTYESRNDPSAAQLVRRSVQVLVELLVADHLPEEFGENNSNELRQLAARLGIDHSRFDKSENPPRIQDDSSLSIRVDHSQCILCERCVRACDDIKQNHVIGRSGKGFSSKIGFDLNDMMGESSCVSCGECAISCPTDALSFRDRVVKEQVAKLQSEITDADEIVTADDLVELPLFSGIPYRFLQFNGGAVVRRRLRPGDVLCREGEYGSTAFLIESGKFEVFLSSPSSRVDTQPASGVLGWLGKLSTKLVRRPGDQSDTDESARSNNDRIFKTSEDVILGEMTCMNRYPRSATVVAVEESQVLEIRRNVLYMLQRNSVSRDILDRAYRERALRSQLIDIRLTDGLTVEQREMCADFLKDKAELLRVDPGQEIFNQGEKADAFFVVRLGFVKVTQKHGFDERVLNYLGPGSHFGDIGLLNDALSTNGDFQSDEESGRRTASCSALDHVELVRIRKESFVQMLQKFPDLHDELVQQAEQTLQRDRESRETPEKGFAHSFLDQGLFNANSLLVIDLESCTRCDECTRACADTHEGVTRLLREGLRFDQYLIASSCRSCLDPYCMVGCPVDAIHREGSLEIRIEDHCIGCGLCADNCPYGNINMHGFKESKLDPTSGKQVAVIQQKATTCDLCRNVVGNEPSCVYACPHEAAFRLSGRGLFDLIENHPK